MEVVVLVYLMKCGHTNNASDASGQPVCVICAGLDIGYNQIDKACSGSVGLEGREAKCNDHKPGHGSDVTLSRWELPFFKYCPYQKYDEYYCGCWGWD